MGIAALHPSYALQRSIMIGKNKKPGARPGFALKR
jgi:hypothetical protein